MGKSSTDDLAAVRVVIDALEPFAAEDQERILRWAREKLGLAQSLVSRSEAVTAVPFQQIAATSSESSAGRLDLKGFVNQKAPQVDTHFAATVAYYYQFEAPDAQRKAAITSQDLLEACRLAGRHRLKNPLTTLNNAHRDGLLDRGPDKGSFVVNSVGENLVAMALPAGSAQVATRRLGTKRKKGAKKK